MAKLSFGIKTTQIIPYEDILSVWLEADALPLIEHAWLLDHPMPIGRSDPSGYCLDGWTTLAALAGRTKRLRLGLMVASNTNQTPPQIAKTAATLDVISGGRLEFGFGAGGVEREHLAYGTDFYPAAERIRRWDEACEIIKRIWTEPVVDFDGRYYHFSEIYCNPKPLQKPAPRFTLGGGGEQLTLRVVAKHADIWNFAGLPGPLGSTADEFRRKSAILDKHCAAIGRDPQSITRSAQLIFEQDNPAATREYIQGYIDAGATHFVLGPRAPRAGTAQWLCDEIIKPLLESNG